MTLLTSKILNDVKLVLVMHSLCSLLMLHLLMVKKLRVLSDSVAAYLFIGENDRQSFNSE